MQWSNSITTGRVSGNDKIYYYTINMPELKLVIVSGSIPSDSEDLAEFVVEGRPIGKKLGYGSYGSVEEVTQFYDIAWVCNIVHTENINSTTLD